MTSIKNEYHINHVEHFYPNATTVVNNYGGGRAAISSSSSKISSLTGMPTVGLTSSGNEDVREKLLRERQRAEILDYVAKLIRCVHPDYVTCYDTLWRDLLAIPEVAADIYNPGKQQGTTFNRNLVAALICMMKDSGIITETNVTRLAELLEGDKDHSVRAALGTPPSSRDILNKVRARIDAL